MAKSFKLISFSMLRKIIKQNVLTVNIHWTVEKYNKLQDAIIKIHYALSVASFSAKIEKNAMNMRHLLSILKMSI
jgi:hypothetical protein